MRKHIRVFRIPPSPIFNSLFYKELQNEKGYLIERLSDGGNEIVTETLKAEMCFPTLPGGGNNEFSNEKPEGR